MLTKQEIENLKRLKQNYIEKAIKEDYNDEHTLDVCITAGILLDRIRELYDESEDEISTAGRIKAAKSIHVQMRRLEELLAHSDEGN